MSLHPATRPIFKDISPETQLSDKQIGTMREYVRGNLQVVAYAILGYADHLCYCCVQYINNIGANNLESIKKYYEGWKSEENFEYEKVCQDIYTIVGPILTERENRKLQVSTKPIDVGYCVDEIVKNTDIKSVGFSRIISLMKRVMERNGN
jgi:hypothetical protein